VGLGDADLDFMFAECGVAASFLATNGTLWSGRAIVDSEVMDLYDADAGQFAGLVKVAKVKTGAFPGMGEASTFRVDGTNYRVIQTRQRGDGAMTDVYLARA
jgi:hypothetical protein